MIRLTRSPSGALLGEQAAPRVSATPPATRANAWEDVSDLSASFGVKLDDWQDAVLQAAMGERADGTWAADVVGLSVPRQNGKSQLLVARALARRQSLYEHARSSTPERWTRGTRNWTPIDVVVLNPERPEPQVTA